MPRCLRITGQLLKAQATKAAAVARDLRGAGGKAIRVMRDNEYPGRWAVYSCPRRRK